MAKVIKVTNKRPVNNLDNIDSIELIISKEEALAILGVVGHTNQSNCLNSLWGPLLEALGGYLDVKQNDIFQEYANAFKKTAAIRRGY